MILRSAKESKVDLIFIFFGNQVISKLYIDNRNFKNLVKRCMGLCGCYTFSL